MRLETVQTAFDKIMQERDALQSRPSFDLDGDQRRRMALANHIEQQLPLRCETLAAEETQKTLAQGGLLMRFMRACNPLYGVCPSTDKSVVTQALTEMVSYYEREIDAARFDPDKSMHNALIARQVCHATVLSGSITVKKPLQLKKPAGA